MLNTERFSTKRNMFQFVLRKKLLVFCSVLFVFAIYLSVVDEVLIYDNSGGKPELIAEKTLESEITILNEFKFNKLKSQYHENI